MLQEAVTYPNELVTKSVTGLMSDSVKEFLTGCIEQCKRIAAEWPDVSKLSAGWRVTICLGLFWVVWSWHFLIALMFLPTMVAFCRDRNWPVLFLANVFLGATPLWAVLMGYAAWTQNTPAPLPRNAVRVTVKTRVIHA